MPTVFVHPHPCAWVRSQLSDFALLRSQIPSQQPYQVITPNRLTARTLGVQKRTLADLALQVLADHQVQLVPRLNDQRLMRAAIQQTVNPTDLDGTTRAWLPTINSLLAAGVGKKNTFQAPPSSLSIRTQQLLQVAQTYQQLLQERGWIDFNQLLHHAAQLQTEPLPLLIYGYFQPTADELKLITEIADPASIMVLPSTEHPDFADVQQAIQQLEANGWQIESSATLNSSTQLSASIGESLSDQFLGQVTASSETDLPAVYAYENLEQEVRGTLAQVKQLLLSKVPVREIGIIARDEAAYGEKLLDIAWEYDVPLRVLYDIPLSASRLGGWLLLLLDVIEQRFPFEPTAMLLSHPLCSNPSAEFWSNVRSQRPSSFPSWNQVSQESLGIDLSELKTLPSRASRDRWVQRFQNLLKLFDLRKRCTRWPRESLAFNKLDKALIALTKMEPESLSRTEFFQELRELMAMLQVSVHPRNGGVELHKPSSVIGARYRYLFVIGMAEGMLPAPVQNDCVLDFFERKQLQIVDVSLPSASALARQEALAFYHLLQTVTEQIVFSYAKLNGKEEQLPSPYLDRLGLKITSPPMPIASLEERRQALLLSELAMTNTMIDGTDDHDPVLAYARHAWQIEQQRESDVAPNEYDGVTGISLGTAEDNWGDRTFSVSQLTKLGLCPFSWFADKVLKLGELDETEDELSPSLQGSLYHKTLEILFKNANSDRDQISSSEALRAAFLEAEQQLQAPDFPAWDVQRDEHLKQLQLTIQQASFYPEDATAIAFEQKFNGNWQGFRITGQIDRIDQTDDGLVLIDYKTSSSPPKGVKNAEGKADVDLQLPIYREAAAPELYPDASVTDAYYYSLIKGQKLSKKQPTEADLAQVANRCQQHLEQGHFPVMPDSPEKSADDRQACKYCDFDLVCRQGNRLRRKTIAQAQPQLADTATTVTSEEQAS
ncbi:MAG: PD-(D/E)XK nuclease family protein [Thainema sp.]